MVKCRITRESWLNRFVSKESYFRILEISTGTKKTRCDHHKCQGKSVLKIILVAKWSGNRLYREVCYIHAKEKGLTESYGMMFKNEEE